MCNITLIMYNRNSSVVVDLQRDRRHILQNVFLVCYKTVLVIHIHTLYLNDSSRDLVQPGSLVHMLLY